MLLSQNGKLAGKLSLLAVEWHDVGKDSVNAGINPVLVYAAKHQDGHDFGKVDAGDGDVFDLLGHGLTAALEV
jgi:hypothetical protein